MIKKICVLAVVAVGLTAVSASTADAYIVRRFAPVRRAVLPPYPVARRVVAGPVVRPVYRPVIGRPYYATPYWGGGVSVNVGW